MEKVWVALAIVFFGVILVGASLLVNGQSSQTQPQPSSTPTPVQVHSPTPIPSATHCFGVWQCGTPKP